MLKENKVILGSMLALVGQTLATDSKCINLAIGKFEHYGVDFLPNGTWTRVPNTGTYYMLAESEDGTYKFGRDTCISMCEGYGEKSKLGALTNEVERLGFKKIRNPREIKMDGLSLLL